MPYPYITFGSQINQTLNPIVDRRLRKTENENRLGYEQQQTDQANQTQRANIDYKAGLDDVAALRKKQDEEERDAFIIDRLVQSGMTPEAATQLHYANVKPQEPVNAFKDILLPMSQTNENNARARRTQAETDDLSHFRRPPAGEKGKLSDIDKMDANVLVDEINRLRVVPDDESFPAEKLRKKRLAEAELAYKQFRDSKRGGSVDQGGEGGGGDELDDLFGEVFK